jgi:hypothetical protein
VSGTDASLNAVWGAEGRAWIIGENGTILRHDGG